MTAKVFLTSKSQDPIDQKTLASLAAVRRIQQSQTQSMDALSSLSFNLNAMTIGKRNDDARARTGSAIQTNAFLVGRQSSKTEHRNASPSKGNKDEAQM
jgi:hypothetical protein